MTASYNAANRVTWTTVNSASNGFTYDSSGNVIFDGVNYNAYGSEGQVCAVQNSPITGGTVAYGYLYDAEGRRVAKGTITVTWTPLAASVCPRWTSSSSSTSTLDEHSGQVTGMGNDANEGNRSRAACVVACNIGSLPHHRPGCSGRNQRHGKRTR